MLRSSNPKTQKFLEIAMKDLKQNGIKLKIYKKTIDADDTSVPCKIDGYFDDLQLEMGVYKDHRWLETFVHEYSHFLQWRDRDPTFTAYYKHEYDPSVLIEKWLSRKISYDRRVENSFKIVRANEMSCDQIAVKLINKYKLPIQTQKYIKKANFQILYYHCVESERCWNVDKIYRNNELWEKIPITFRMSYVQHAPSRLMNIASKSF